MFKVSPISSHTGVQPCTPLVDCLVDDVLLQTRPCGNQAPLQVSNVEYRHAVDFIRTVSYTHLTLPTKRIV